MKKILIAFIALIAISTLFGCDNKKTTAYNKELYTEGLVIEGNQVKGYFGDNEKVIIPEVYEGVTITEIVDGAFSSNTTIKEVVMPNTITKIYSGSFFRCTNLEKISFSNNLKEIGTDAFGETQWLYNQNSGCVYAGTVLYSYNEKEEVENEIIVKDGTISISANAFNGNINITKLVLPSSLEKIGEKAFFGCTNLEEIEASLNIKECGEKAFHNTKWLNNQEDGFVFLGSLLYTYKGIYKDGNIVNVKDGTTAIADYALNGVITVDSSNQVTNVYKVFNLPNSLTHIGAYAFADSLGFGKVNFGSGVSYIGEFAFSKTSLETIVIPEKVKEIKESTFEGCKYLYSCDFSNSSVEKIGLNAFKGCSILNLNLNDTVKEIGQFAFTENTYLETINFGKVEMINDNAFNGCTKLDKITFSNELELIGAYSFYGCEKIGSIDLSNTKVSTIGEGAFYGCLSINDVKFSNNLDVIERYAFSGCSSIEQLNLGNTVTYIGEYAFNKLTKIKSVTIPTCVKEIKSNAFNGCDLLSNVIIMSDKPFDIGKTVFPITAAIEVPSNVDSFKAKWKAYADQLVEKK